MDFEIVATVPKGFRVISWPALGIRTSKPWDGGSGRFWASFFELAPAAVPFGGAGVEAGPRVRGCHSFFARRLAREAEALAFPHDPVSIRGPTQTHWHYLSLSACLGLGLCGLLIYFNFNQEKIILSLLIIDAV